MLVDTVIAFSVFFFMADATVMPLRFFIPVSPGARRVEQGLLDHPQQVHGTALKNARRRTDGPDIRTESRCRDKGKRNGAT